MHASTRVSMVWNSIKHVLDKNLINKNEMKKILKTFTHCLMMAMFALVLNAVMGATIGSVVGADSQLCAYIAMGAGVLLSVAGMPTGLCAGVLTEIWTGEMIKAFRTAPEQLGWYDRIRSYDQYVKNDVIHFTELGGDPTVLVNNTTYPISVTSLEDADKPISLDKFDTTATSVTDDELHAVSYDKMASVQERHREALKAAVYKKALHAIAPNSNVPGETPVLRTTGEYVAAESRLRITPSDIVSLKAAFDKMKMPATNRILVLNSEHVNDLLLVDQKFREAYNINQTEGKIARLYGFDIYELSETPTYTSAGNKRGWGVTAETGDRNASVAFHFPSMMKANGSVQFYHQEAATDPQYHRNLVNFRKWGICLPLKAKYTRGAIVSAVQTTAPSE